MPKKFRKDNKTTTAARSYLKRFGIGLIIYSVLSILVMLLYVGVFFWGVYSGQFHSMTVSDEQWVSTLFQLFFAFALPVLLVHCAIDIFLINRGIKFIRQNLDARRLRRSLNLINTFFIIEAVFAVLTFCIIFLAEPETGIVLAVALIAKFAIIIPACVFKHKYM